MTDKFNDLYETVLKEGNEVQDAILRKMQDAHGGFDADELAKGLEIVHKKTQDYIPVNKGEFATALDRLVKDNKVDVYELPHKKQKKIYFHPHIWPKKRIRDLVKVRGMSKEDALKMVGK